MLCDIWYYQEYLLGTVFRRYYFENRRPKSIMKQSNIETRILLYIHCRISEKWNGILLDSRDMDLSYIIMTNAMRTALMHIQNV